MPQTSTALEFNGHSMAGALQRVLVCSPQTAGWKDSRVSRWQELGFHHAPDFSKAQSQHGFLCRELHSAGAEIIELPPSPDLTLDAVYTHDPSLATDDGLIVMRPGKSNRIAEGPQHATVCQTLSIPTLATISAPGATEAGDILWLDPKTLLIGQGYRTNAAGIQQIRDLLAPKNIEVLSAPLPHGPGPSACLHLMSLISLLDDHTALVDLPWLAVETVEFLQSRGFNFIEIEYSERETLACNVLALGNNRLTSALFPAANSASTAAAAPPASRDRCCVVKSSPCGPFSHLRSPRQITNTLQGRIHQWRWRDRDRADL
jgi:N-dimethylarginine dimethylaminohydrolase